MADDDEEVDEGPLNIMAWVALVASLAMQNGCGIAPDESGLLASSGEGALGGFAGSPAPLTTFELNFDNHLRLLKAV